MNLDQLRARDELGTDRAIVFVGTAGLRICPWEPATDRRIVELVMDTADVVLEEHTTTTAHAGAPFTPAGTIGRRISVCPDESERLVVTERNAVGTAG